MSEVGIINLGACFGWHDEEEQGCQKCMIAFKCEERTPLRETRKQQLRRQTEEARERIKARKMGTLI